ncbi:methylenetetrahydromethanopterin reductase [Haladaptatus paucihalophilus DX253]|uniref:5,10-methylenetetrahydromethanopterin reductase n=1 Tax=Haladaptatus paucihalophilus DX253 TaxID=797209 RepID=E7QTV3_HALPU|nr:MULTISPECIES: 5,10-methylenetetrahydromethanopterin reductase [Haladaptatus]EFW92032.1 methylenetetrahydromethanopterin reductase [Haladaptatus paucihalophilus DX253]GKZ14187.1 5,10-methylenetetrahydromethanopterin reductase [Haladaptatus sp. T7]SHK86308.1 5,10-methylenetetrahydromethanopterin reductase [Haladaptatus paucihalophilus DX253]
MRGIELTPEEPIAELVEHGKTAEDEGFDTLFASSHYNNRDPFTVLSRVADATEDIRLGPGVVNPYESHPVTLASRVATLDEASDGRAVFGVGAGDRSTLRNLGIDRDRPLRRVLETMKVSKDLWAGERVTHDGTFTARDAGLNYDVGEIPVYVGAQGPHMLRMSAKHADGALVNASHPRDFDWASDRIEEGLAERPDERGEFDFAAYACVSVAEDGDAAREAARPPVAFIAGGTAEPVLDRHGIDEEAAGEIGKSIEAGEFAAAFEAVTPAMIDAFCIAGTPETVADRIAAVLDYADSFVAGSPLGPDRENAVSLVAAALDRARRRRA